MLDLILKNSKILLSKKMDVAEVIVLLETVVLCSDPERGSIKQVVLV